MYIKRKDVIGGNKIKLLEDLEFLLKESGFYTVLKYQDVELRGKKLFARKGTTFWSFTATNFNNLDSETDITPYDINDENLIGYKSGGFKIFINSSQNILGDIVSRQPKITGSVTSDAGGVCPLPRNDKFSYEIYSTIDGFEWGVILKFEDLTFYVFFGDKSGGTDVTGNYSFSSSPFASNKMIIPFDFNNEQETTLAGRLPVFPLAGVGSNNSNFFCNYADSLKTQINGVSGSLNTYDPQAGGVSQNALKGVYNKFYDEYAGISQIVRTELFVNNYLGEVNSINKFYDFNFGFANINKDKSLDIKRIDNKRIKFLINGRKEKVMNKNNIASYNNLMFWFEVR
jgi:hypothetical protein